MGISFSYPFHGVKLPEDCISLTAKNPGNIPVTIAEASLGFKTGWVQKKMVMTDHMFCQSPYYFATGRPPFELKPGQRFTNVIGINVIRQELLDQRVTRKSIKVLAQYRDETDNVFRSRKVSLELSEDKSGN